MKRESKIELYEAEEQRYFWFNVLLSLESRAVLYFIVSVLALGFILKTKCTLCVQFNIRIDFILQKLMKRSQHIKLCPFFHNVVN